MNPSVPMEKSGQQYLMLVQILRFAAALLVVFGHTEQKMLELASAASVPAQALGIIDWGLGVDVFFVISGFIMYYLTHGQFGRPGVSRSFLQRRLIRIVPLYWVFTSALLAMLFVAASRINNNSVDIFHIAASYLFVPWPRADGEIFPLLSLGWTLNYEMMFYGLFAIALMFSRRTGLLVLVAMFAALILGGLLAPAHWWPLKFWGNAIIGEFLLGVGLAAVFLSGYRMKPLTCGVLLIAGIVSAMVFYQTGTYEVVTRLITGGVPAILITGAVVLLDRDVKATILTRALALGGDASYALYLCHPFTINIAAILWVRSGMQSLSAFFWLTVILSIIGSIVVHFLIEKPCIATLKHLTEPKKRAGAVRI